MCRNLKIIIDEEATLMSENPHKQSDSASVHCVLRKPSVFVPMLSLLTTHLINDKIGEESQGFESKAITKCAET